MITSFQNYVFQFQEKSGLSKYQSGKKISQWYLKIGWKKNHSKLSVFTYIKVLILSRNYYIPLSYWSIINSQIFDKFANLLPNWTLIQILTLLPNFGGFHRTLQRVRLANRGRLLLRTPGPVPFGTCICSNVENILSWTCHVYGPFEFQTSFGTSILLCYLSW